MIKKIILFVNIINLFYLCCLAGENPKLTNPMDSILNGEDHVPDRVVLKSNISSASQLQKSLMNGYAGEIKNVRLDPYGNYYIIETDNKCDIERLCENLKKEDYVEDASPDYYALPTSGNFNINKPNDPYFHFQYALQNTGQIYYFEFNIRGTEGSDIKALQGWHCAFDGHQTSDIVIAVIDTGVAWNHEDLKNQVISGFNFFDNNNNFYDEFGHGTSIASIAAAETNNGLGIAGTCWNAKILSVKAAGPNGLMPITAIASGLRYAADYGARVINMSFVAFRDSFMLKDACKYAFEKGAVLVAAAGNYGLNKVFYPAAYDEYCLAVGATEENDQLWDFSDYGPEIDVVAPGVNILSAFFDPEEPDILNAYQYQSGTSDATPYVSGAAALLLTQKPFLTNTQVMDLIRFTADDVNKDQYPGVDIYMGYGRINLQRLLCPYLFN
ncbi:MAG: S8 family serine peptidase [Candidatus Omnitrophota bacterium]